ncbi:MAG: Fe-Mn family superoxide dismutase [Caldisphaera sp.]|nr:MAG: hypothetical protein C0201_02565 [Caldisphaera sp.]PMP90486.1 MAG: hypothetical protein C0171_04865 [Caldisphaera sp.]
MLASDAFEYLYYIQYKNDRHNYVETNSGI